MYTIPRQYLYCEQTTSGSIVSALYRLDIRCIVYNTAPISILCANNIRPIYNLYCSIVSALIGSILGTPYIRYWANIHTVCKRLSHSIGPIHACIVKGYRYNIVPISHCFLGNQLQDGSRSVWRCATSKFCC